MVLALLLFVFCFMRISRWQLYSDHSCSSEGIFAVYSMFAYGLYPWLPAELIVTRQLIHFLSINKKASAKKMSAAAAHTQLPARDLLFQHHFFILCSVQHYAFSQKSEPKRDLVKPHETQLSILTSSTILLKSGRRVLQCLVDI